MGALDAVLWTTARRACRTVARDRSPVILRPHVSRAGGRPPNGYPLIPRGGLLDGRQHDRRAQRGTGEAPVEAAHERTEFFKPWDLHEGKKCRSRPYCLSFMNFAYDPHDQPKDWWVTLSGPATSDFTVGHLPRGRPRHMSVVFRDMFPLASPEGPVSIGVPSFEMRRRVREDPAGSGSARRADRRTPGSGVAGRRQLWRCCGLPSRRLVLMAS